MESGLTGEGSSKAGAGSVERDVLGCPGCGAPLVIGATDTARCELCGSESRVPERYRALRDARAAHEAHRARAESLLPLLIRPSRRWVAIASSILDQPLLALTAYYGVPIFVGALYIAFSLVPAEPPGGVSSVALLLAWVVGRVFLFWVLLVGFALVPRLLTVAAVRGAAGRRRLVGALQGAPPAVPGGSPRCRVCGAPIDVAPGRLVVECLYCTAENVVIATSQAVATRATADRLVRSIAEAVAEDSRERRRERRAVVRVTLRYLAAGVVGAAASLALNPGLVVACLPLIVLVWSLRTAPTDDALRRDLRESGRGVSRSVRFAVGIIVWLAWMIAGVVWMGGKARPSSPRAATRAVHPAPR